MKATRSFLSALLVPLIVAGAGCQHIGPPTIADDRLAYNDAIATSWKQQLLLNIVRIRYGDMVEFVDVGSITQGHQLSRGATGTFNATLFPFAYNGNSLAPGLSGTRMTTDSPTITYAPLADAKFTRHLLTPITVTDICQLIEGGASASALLDMALDSMNEFHNRRVVAHGKIRVAESAHPDWTSMIEAIATAHAEGAVTFPADPKDEKKVFMVIPVEGEAIKAGDQVALIRTKLQLRSLQSKFEIKFGTYAWKNDEVIVRTRSVIQAMQALSEFVEVPVCHLATGRAKPLENAGVDDDPLIRIWSGRKKPCDAFAAVHYQGYWFWVDQHDDGARSKQSMIQLRTLMALADTGDRPAGPLLTIPTR